MQVKGKWWIVRGLNCGQKGWPAGFDYFPCQRDEFVIGKDGNWVDHIAYCGGKNNTCQTPIVFTVANVSLTSPGVMTHWYLLSSPSIYVSITLFFPHSLPYLYFFTP